MTEQLAGKVALVTGGGSGIGQASALAFARQGAKVALADVNAEGGEKTVSMIREAGSDCIFIYADVSKATDVEAMVRKTIEVYGRLDCAFNNAGILAGSGPIHESSEENWDRVMAINLKGVWLCMKYEIPQMLKQGSGAIVNTASLAGLVGERGNAIYTASKHGVVGLTRSAALQYARNGIRINAVCPGFIHTAMIDPIIAQRPEFEAALDARHPVGRMGAPEEIAEAVVWLCSDAASFVTGHAMAVDGGYTTQ